jgi:hypothetical protein
VTFIVNDFYLSFISVLQVVLESVLTDCNFLSFLKQCSHSLSPNLGVGSCSKHQFSFVTAVSLQNQKYKEYKSWTSFRQKHWEGQQQHFKPVPTVQPLSPQVTQDIVPQQLIDHFVSMTHPSQVKKTDCEIVHYCAFSLPAVALTLGRDNWVLLKDAHEALASHMQVII